MERLAGFVILQRGTLQVHAQFCSPDGHGVRSRPHQIRSRKPLGVWLEAQQARRVREHRLGVGLSEALTAQHIEKDLGMVPSEIDVGAAFWRLVAKMPLAIDHLLGRATADAKLEPTARDQVTAPASSTM
ncbi:hypothetical protein [Limimaricola cinnabarinus]|uniref:hypothetical protein n=1 Tax=Limimaricola cinnabarinus TaxID=1125964 RepID=UPI003D7E5866